MKPLTHNLLKNISALKQKKFREEHHLLLVEGRHPVEEALRAGLRPVHFVAMTDTSAGHLPASSFLEAIPPEIRYEADESRMVRMSSTSSASPCIGVFEQPAMPESLAGTMILVLDGIQDPGNLGTLLRSAVAFGVDSVVLAGDCVDAFNPKAIRASAGLVFALPVIACETSALPALLSGANWQIYTTSGDPAAVPYRAADFIAPCVIALGNEGRGLSDGLFGEISVTGVTIPMDARVESLNVAMSGGIILAEAAAQRQASRLMEAHHV